MTREVQRGFRVLEYRVQDSGLGVFWVTKESRRACMKEAIFRPTPCYTAAP